MLSFQLSTVGTILVLFLETFPALSIMYYIVKLVMVKQFEGQKQLSKKILF